MTADAEAEAPILWPSDVNRRPWCWERLMAGGEGDDKRMRWLDDMSLSKHWEIVKDREAWHAAVHGVTKSWTWLSDWTTKRNYQCDHQNSEDIKTKTWKESYDQPREHIEKQRHYFVNKGPSSQAYGFSSGYVWMWELDCEESWVPKS